MADQSGKSMVFRLYFKTERLAEISMKGLKLPAEAIPIKRKNYDIKRIQRMSLNRTFLESIE